MEKWQPTSVGLNIPLEALGSMVLRIADIAGRDLKNTVQKWLYTWEADKSQTIIFGT